jgi:hypothetical protein
MVQVVWHLFKCQHCEKKNPKGWSPCLLYNNVDSSTTWPAAPSSPEMQRSRAKTGPLPLAMVSVGSEGGPSLAWLSPEDGDQVSGPGQLECLPAVRSSYVFIMTRYNSECHHLKSLGPEGLPSSEVSRFQNTCAYMKERLRDGTQV